MERWRRRRRLARATVLVLTAVLPVTALAVVVRSETSGVHRADVEAVRAATRLTSANPDLYRALLVWQEVFQARWVNLAAVVLCAGVVARAGSRAGARTPERRGLRGRALWALTTILVIWALANGLKVLVARARPALEDALTRAPGYSFPSGHAMNTAATGVVVVLLLWPLLGRRGRAAAVTLLTVAVVGTATDRVLLGAHYPSDVVAGVVLGAALAGASYLGYHGWGAVPVPPEEHASSDTPTSADLRGRG
ncbi:phosphoesterase PA-phosphatase [Actinotalea ferrariae CF5-4]|uniref:Phosphoesterase PA-phosphatase n=1 Tax=Actinotalea ferrariae CF5-4 TaxID=948458 RepID=A0A021VR51_9CELL|nr:phosphatase PAP2 family protein [Actinotalea ferrariae]EYR63603.1 phosphoesterase PA-phosphatase [Actinotalea ferrariae CF5-4]